MNSSIDPIVDLLLGKSNEEVNLDEFIAKSRIVAESDEYAHKREGLNKNIEFFNYMLYKQGCVTLADVYSKIENAAIPIRVMDFFVAEGYVGHGMKVIVSKGYPDIEFPKLI
jgi:hypothetical protein